MGPTRGGLKKRRKVEKNGFSDKPESRDWWTDFSKRICGRLTTSKGLDTFESVFKISRTTFHYVCSLVQEDLTKKPGNLSFSNGKPLSLYDLVAVAMRRLTSGDSLLNIGDAFGLNQSTVSIVTWRFVESMEVRALHHLQWPKTESEIAKIKAGFEEIRGLPNCCGAIDTTHIMMCLPQVDPTTKVWLDREKNHSMLLQAVVDPTMRFMDVVTGWPGKMSDSLVLQSSSLFKLCEKGKRLNGESEYIVGDSGFPLLSWLITPYVSKDLSEAEAEFNNRHFATRMVAMRALARFKDMWRIIEGQMWRPDKNKLPRIILVCCLLHNIIIDMDDDAQDEMTLSHLHDQGYRQQVCKSVEKSGSVARNELSRYLAAKQPS